MANRTSSQQLMLFLVFGAVQLWIDWALFVALTTLGLGVVLANIVGRVAGAVIGFALNHRFTFAQTARGGDWRGQIVRFLMGWAATALISTLLVAMVEMRLGLSAAWAWKLVIDGLIALLAFLLSKYWIFR